MSTDVPDANESIKLRTVCALTEYMGVLPEGGEIYTVVGQNGFTYTFDRLEWRCTCPNAKHRSAACKHQSRVAFATDECLIPIGADGVDVQLGEHTEADPRVVASDGGIIQGNDGEILESDTDERPKDCDWWDADAGLPCWVYHGDSSDKSNSVADCER